MIKVQYIRRTSAACPSQWEGGTEDGRELYVRYRWGWLAAHVHEGAFTLDDPIFSARVGTEYHGDMTTEQMIEHLDEVLDFSGCDFDGSEFDD